MQAQIRKRFIEQLVEKYENYKPLVSYLIPCDDDINSVLRRTDDSMNKNFSKHSRSIENPVIYNFGIFVVTFNNKAFMTPT